jgi:hypothetical protein
MGSGGPSAINLPSVAYFSEAQGRFNRRRLRLAGARQQVAVHVHGESHGRVPELVRGHLRVHVRPQQLGGVEVAQVVEPDAGQPIRLASRRKAWELTFLDMGIAP